MVSLSNRALSLTIFGVYRMTDYSVSRYGQYDDVTVSAWSLLQTSVYSEPVPAAKQINSDNYTAGLKIGWFESYLFDRPQLQKPMGVIQ